MAKLLAGIKEARVARRWLYSAAVMPAVTSPANNNCKNEENEHEHHAAEVLTSHMNHSLGVLRVEVKADLRMRFRRRLSWHKFAASVDPQPLGCSSEHTCIPRHARNLAAITGAQIQQPSCGDPALHAPSLASQLQATYARCFLLHFGIIAHMQTFTSFCCTRFCESMMAIATLTGNAGRQGF